MAATSAVKTSVTELPESRVRVDAEVPAEEVERRVQQAARQLGREMRIPGFRKGKVPPPVVIRRLGRGAVLDEALRSALGNWYLDAIDHAGIVPIGEPDLDVGDLPAEGQPLAFSIEIAVRPRAKLGTYKGLEVGRREPHVEDAAVDEELERLRDRFATLDTVERPAATGDHVVIDYLGTIDGEPFEGGEGRDQLLELGSGRLIPGFEEQLIGASAGDERTVEVTFPEDYPGGLAGTEASFAVKVSEVKAKRLPEPDDDFASEASEFDTLAELRADIEGRLRAQIDDEIEGLFRAAAIDELVRASNFTAAGPLVEARTRELLNGLARSLQERGVDASTYLQLTGQTPEVLEQRLRAEASQSVSRELVLEAVADQLGIEVTDDEIREELRAAGESDDDIEAFVADGGADRVRDDIRLKKALDRIAAEVQPIAPELHEARESIWTPEKDEPAESPKLWTPGSKE